MVKPEQVPEAAWKATGIFNEHAAREAVANAINAWPGGKNDPWWDLMTHKKRVSIILPLPADEVKPTPKTLGGWAEGEYSHKHCKRCGKDFEGDKRAWHCRNCSMVSALTDEVKP